MHTAAFRTDTRGDAFFIHTYAALQGGGSSVTLFLRVYFQ